VVDSKRIIGKMEGQGGGEAQGVADQKKRVLAVVIAQTLTSAVD
jgi:hypothetical protein